MADVPSADATGTRTVARGVVAGARLDGRRWRRRWNGMPIRLANGPGHSRRAVRRRWFLNRVVVPPPRVGSGAAGRPRIKYGVTLLPAPLGVCVETSQKRLVKADPVRRKALVAEYAALTAAARRTGAKILFADEAHFQTDADLRGKWVLKREPALVASTSPRRGEKERHPVLDTVPATTRRYVWKPARWR